MRIAQVEQIIVTPKLRVVRFGVPHSEVERQTEFKSFAAAHLGQTQARTWIEQLEAHASYAAGQFIPLI